MIIVVTCSVSPYTAPSWRLRIWQAALNFDGTYMFKGIDVWLEILAFQWVSLVAVLADCRMPPGLLSVT